MADIFKSKEVFKNLNQSIGYRAKENENVRRLRGLYVTGVYRPPHYIDRTLFISDINSNIPLIESYGDKHAHVNSSNYIATFKTIKAVGDLQITRFLQNHDYAKPGNYIVTFKNVGTSGSLQFTKFMTNNEHIVPPYYGTNYIVTFQNIKTSGSMAFQRIGRNFGNEIPPGKSVLQIRAINSEPAVISSVSS